MLDKEEGEIHLQSLAEPLVHEFEDVFPDDLPPGLRLIRGIEDPIDYYQGLPFQISQPIGVILWRPRSHKGSS